MRFVLLNCAKAVRQGLGFLQGPGNPRRLLWSLAIPLTKTLANLTGKSEVFKQ